MLCGTLVFWPRKRLSRGRGAASEGGYEVYQNTCIGLRRTAPTGLNPSGQLEARGRGYYGWVRTTPRGRAVAGKGRRG